MLKLQILERGRAYNLQMLVNETKVACAEDFSKSYKTNVFKIRMDAKSLPWFFFK